MIPVAVKKRRGRPPKNPISTEQPDEAWAEKMDVCWYRLWGEEKQGPYKTIVAAVEAMEAARAKRDVDLDFSAECMI